MNTSRWRTSRLVGLGLAFMLGLVFVPSALADESKPPESEQAASRQLQGRFAGWILSMERGAPSSAYMCGEVSMFGGWSVLGCGSGSGVMYRPLPAETDFTHFRAQYAMPLFASAPGSVEIGPGVGLAEVQRGPDQSGFVFDPKRSSRPVEASGPEVALELDWTVAEGNGPFETLRMKWDAGIAWVPGAPAVVGASSPTVTFSTITVNGTF